MVETVEMTESKAGRPQKKIPWDLIEGISECSPTLNQLAEAVNRHGYKLSPATIKRAIERRYGITYEEFKARRTDNIRLRLIQKAITMAEGGNTKMLIFALKNMCGWRESPKEDDDQYARMTTQELVVLVKQKIPELAATPPKEEDV